MIFDIPFFYLTLIALICICFYIFIRAITLPKSFYEKKQKRENIIRDKIKMQDIKKKEEELKKSLMK